MPYRLPKIAVANLEEKTFRFTYIGLHEPSANEMEDIFFERVVTRSKCSILIVGCGQ